jgi:TetR/AcrR family transcriptional regulator, cholesterol catabolism regulator
MNDETKTAGSHSQLPAGSTERRGEAEGEENTAGRLLRLAAGLFRQKGYAASTTRELASLLGIQKASLYHHIRGKEDLLFAISVQSLEHITEAVTVARDTADPDQRLHMMITAHLVTALEDQDMHTTMLIELRSLSPERQHEVRERRDAYQAILRDAISEDQKAGRLRDDIGAGYLTLSLLNLLNWTIFWFDPAGSCSAAELAAMMWTIFHDGARARGTVT